MGLDDEPVGVLLSVLSSILSNLGVNTQKLSLMREAKKETTRRRPYAKQHLWQLGLLLVVVGSLGDFAALGFAAQVTPGALLAFLLLGPVVDLKMAGLYTTLMRPKAIGLTAVVSALAVLLLGQWVNLWRL